MRLSLCLAAALALSGCGSEPDQASAGESVEIASSGVTVDLPAAEPPAEAELANIAEAAALPPPAEWVANQSADAPAEKPRAPEPEPKQAPAPTPEPKTPAVVAAVDPPAPSPAPTPAAQPPSTGGRAPLSNDQLGYHIRRIGFPCGEVVSANQVSAGPVYRIECSGGTAYQGTMRRGRLRFRRWSGG